MKAAKHPLRGAIRAKLLATNSVPEAYVDQVVDLAIHAENNAAEALRETLNSTPDTRIFITAGGIAISMLISRLEELRDIMAALAAETGLPVHRATVHSGTVQ